MKKVVFFSGGSGSYEALARLVEGGEDTANIHLLFTDTGIEHKDLYMLLVKTFSKVFKINTQKEQESIDKDLPEVYNDLHQRLEMLTEIADNVMKKTPNVHWLHYRHKGNFVTPWYLFEAQDFIGNSRVAPCSAIIKQRLAKEYIKHTFPDKDIEVIFGIDWSESHRMKAPIKHWSPFVSNVDFPLNREPWSTSDKRQERLINDGVGLPEMYALGFPHHNCGGFCCKAGQGHFKLLMEKLPKVFEYHADKEAKLASRLKAATGKEYSLMTKHINGIKSSYTLRQLEADVKGLEPVDEYDLSGCGCFVTEDMEDTDLDNTVKFSVKDLKMFKGFTLIK